MINVRLATKNDKTDVLKLLDELLTSIEETQGHGAHDPVEEVGSEMFDEMLESGKVMTFVAEDEGKILGIATLFTYPVVRRGHYRGQLEELVVTEQLRGKGIGTALLNAVIDYCKQHNIPSMRLNSGIELTKAHAFYEKHGGKFTEKMFRFDF